MVELVIASGKGGTGKTSIVGSLASLAKKAILVDCDVDAANLHLIISHTVLTEHDFSSSSKASIIEDKCSSCGICKDSCRFGAIEYDMSLSPVPYRIDPLSCEGCGLCKQVCPEDAIAFDPVISGEWFESNSEYGPFYHARLGIAEANSGKLVSLLRNQAREEAKASKTEFIIVDGPPGIGCPVIASLTGATYLLLVTEPSLSAIHDMKRLIELANHFKIKAGVCINKCDINSDLTGEIESYAEANEIRVHGRIPFDKKFTEAQIQGKPYLHIASKQNADIIGKIWQSVLHEINVLGNELLKSKTE
jgi:MinD superfamily P-loop ATPase